jgi:hypothetical protein
LAKAGFDTGRDNPSCPDSSGRSTPDPGALRLVVANGLDEATGVSPSADR